MQTTDSKLPGAYEQEARKKTYRKPSVQVYGTLTQMTKGNVATSPVNLDGTGPSPTPKNRT